MRKTLAILLLSAFPMMAGCNYITPLFVIFAPDEQNKTVDAEYKDHADLEKHSLAIVVYHSMRVQYEYPDAREWVTRAIASRFEQEEVLKKIKGLHVVRPGVVLKYQQENVHWDDLDKTQLGKALGADYVLFVALSEFTTREPASIYQLQGLVTAEVALYKTDLPERDSRVFKSDDIRVINPKNTPGGTPGYNDTKIREDMIKEFAEKVVWKFYKHDEKVEDES
jgi:TolB-like protein